MRTPQWSKKVDAPEPLLEFYRAIERVQNKSDLFLSCHVFQGATLNHIPYVSANNETVALPRLISKFMGVPYGKKTCATHGCCNPFHFQHIDPPLKGIKGTVVNPKSDSVSLEDYIEAVQHVIDMKEISCTFESLRPLIPVEDISDELLTLSIEKMNHD